MSHWANEAASFDKNPVVNSRSRSSGGAIRYHPIKASAAACRRSIVCLSLASGTIVRRPITCLLGDLRARKRDLIIRRDARIIRAPRPLEYVTPRVPYDGAARWLAAFATSVRVVK